MSVTYKQAGVDVSAADSLVEWLRADHSPSPHADKLVEGIGGFAALFRMKFPEIKKPVLVSATDGVGTKIKLACDFGAFAGIGQDLVAMCVNDLICTGGQPLFFLDYFASGKLNGETARSLLTSIRVACVESGCALIGGETAEMPGIYHGNDIDLAGFSVGIVDEDKILGAKRVRNGDVVIGVSSSGFHSNGYSLLRKIYAEDLAREQKAGGGPISEKLLRPTHLYAKLALSLEGAVSAIAHITGGGIQNIPRVLPKGAVLRLLPWAWPEMFVEVQDRAQLSREEMLNTFNCGVGLVLVVSPDHQNQVMKEIGEAGFSSYELGCIEIDHSESEAQIVF